MRLAVVLTTLLSCVLLLATPTSRADTAEEVDQLRAELALVKMKLKSAEKKLADGSNNAPSSSTESDRKPREKPISDLTEILRTLPEEAQPGPNGEWSTSSAAEANERLEYSVWGTPFQSELTIYRLEIKENPQLREDAAASPWLIEITFQNQSIEYSGKSITQGFKPLKIYADDARARRARKLEIGDQVRVRASLVTITRYVYGLTMPKPNFILQLRDVDIPGITE